MDSHPLTFESSFRDEAVCAEDLVRLFWEVRADASAMLTVSDQRMKRYHDSAGNLIDVAFEPGDLVMR